MQRILKILKISTTIETTLDRFLLPRSNCCYHTLPLIKFRYRFIENEKIRKGKVGGNSWKISIDPADRIVSLSSRGERAGLFHERGELSARIDEGNAITAFARHVSCIS